MRLDDLLEDFVYEGPFALACLAGGVWVWARRERLGRPGVIAALTLFGLLAAHLLAGGVQRLAIVLSDARPSESAAWLRHWAFTGARAGRAAALGLGFVVLARCATRRALASPGVTE